MKTTEMSSDDEHEEDVVRRSMSETLCEGEPSSSSPTARPKRRSLVRTAARAGGRIRRGRKDHRWGEDLGDDGTGDMS